MKIIIKQLQGGEVSLEVTPTTTILEIKEQIEEKLKIPVASQRLLFLGRPLIDKQLVESYPIKEGTKLNLAVKKPDGLYEVAIKEYKKQGMSDTEASKAANRLMVITKEKFDQMSWDDLDKLTLDFMLIEDGVRRLRIEPDNLEEPNVL
ncbi:ubiquitin-like protein 4A [Epargyreus clarus]|uniref:ubiquitin-like protein 4A n=1 Tax=Epargyreus clarus TaxID=520877 RepID=UPI003C2F1987